MKFILIIILSPFLFSSPLVAQQTVLPRNSTKIVFKNEKSRHRQLKAEVIRKLINPLIRESAKPISDITIDFCPVVHDGEKSERICKKEAGGKLTISVTVNTRDGSSGVDWIETRDGSLDAGEYRRIFKEDPKFRKPNHRTSL